MLGHKIRVSSIEGKGSVFAVEVPKAKQILPNVATGPQIPMITERLVDADVWLIDNDAAICEAMETLLTGWGCNIVTALSLDDLRSQVNFHNDSVDILIADYHLDNGENGLNAAKIVTSEVPHNLPVLMITANYSKELNQEIRDLDYMLVNKPVKPLKLKTTLIHMLGS